MHVRQSTPIHQFTWKIYRKQYYSWQDTWRMREMHGQMHTTEGLTTVLLTSDPVTVTCDNPVADNN